MREYDSIRRDVATFRNAMGIEEVWPKMCATCKFFKASLHYGGRNICRRIEDFSKKHLDNRENYSFSEIMHVKWYNFCKGGWVDGQADKQ